MNTFMFTGVVTSDATEEEAITGLSGYRINFHVNIETKSKLKVWAQCTLSGNKGREIVDDLWKGQIVTVRGEISGKSDWNEGGPIWVMAKEVIPHDIYDDDDE